MEPTEKPMSKRHRAILPLLKARVVERNDGYIKISFGAEYGSPTTITIIRDMRLFDIRDGDLLPLYTEVLIAEGKGDAQ